VGPQVVLVRLEGGHGGEQALPPGATGRGEGGEEVDRGRRPGHELVGQGAELEALGHVVRRRQQLGRGQRLEQGRIGGEDAAVRAEELVRRAGEEVRAERAHVHRGVGGQVDSVDGEQRPGRMNPRGDLRDRRPGADQVRRTRDGDQPRPLGEHLGDVVGGELAGRRVERRPAHGRTGGLGGDHPRPDVRVVVEAGDDDLVAVPPAGGQRAGDVEGELGGAAAEDDPARIGAEEVGQGLPGVADDVVGQPFRGGDPAAVGDRRGERRGDRPSDGLGHLGAAGAVEVGGARPQRREVRPDRGDVVGHAAGRYRPCSGIRR
jgi:hypothetical protein